MAISSYKTYLMQGSTKLVDIKTTPNLGGSPEMLETTTLSDGMQTFIPGIQMLEGGGLQFTANYTESDFDTIKALDDGTAKSFKVQFGDSGADGEFSFSGYISVFPNGVGVNEVVEMTITIAPTTVITKS